MNEFTLELCGKVYNERDVEEMEAFHRHCLKHVMAGNLWRYEKLWSFIAKFRKKQKKFRKKERKMKKYRKNLIKR